MSAQWIRVRKKGDSWVVAYAGKSIALLYIPNISINTPCTFISPRQRHGSFEHALLCRKSAYIVDISQCRVEEEILSCVIGGPNMTGSANDEKEYIKKNLIGQRTAFNSDIEVWTQTYAFKIWAL